jgi:serine/threonine protein phosphatase PrpC
MHSKRVSIITRHLVVASSKNDDGEQRIDDDDEDEHQRVSTFKWSSNIVSATLPGSIMGKTKINQDIFAFNKDTQCACLCDGHGENGEMVSEIVSRAITSASQYKSNHKHQGKEKEVDLANQIQQAIRDKLDNASLYSGSTCVWARLINDGKVLRICNVGDSRCIVIDHNWNVLFETLDHKPDHPKETERIRSYGGYVTKRPGSVARVAGLALSRAFGDFAASNFGVIANPDVTDLPVDSIKFVFLASDGIIDTYETSNIVEFLKKHITLGTTNVHDCLRNLVKICRDGWLEDTTGEYCDDITCALWFIS